MQRVSSGFVGRWLSILYVAVVLGLGVVSLWPKLTVQFAPTEVRTPMRTAVPEAALPSPTPGLVATNKSPLANQGTPKQQGAGKTWSLPTKKTATANPYPLTPTQPPKNTVRTLTPGPVRPTTSKVNLNTASPAELESLPRIGPAMSKRIIEGRPYRSLEDLDRVKGVGPKLLETLAPLVTF